MGRRCPKGGRGLFTSFIFPSPRKRGEGARRAGEGLVVRSSFQIFTPMGWVTRMAVNQSISAPFLLILQVCNQLFRLKEITLVGVTVFACV